MPNDGISFIPAPFTKSIVIDPNESVRYGIPVRDDYYMNCIDPNQQPSIESSGAEKFINNTLNQQQTLAKLQHSQQYPSSLMPFYHRRQLLAQQNFEQHQQSNQYAPPLSTQQTYGSGIPVPVANRQNSTSTLSMSSLSSYHYQ